ncbi:methyltransferase [Nostoc sp. FACHB-110]|uniref:methyltransferase n=1 Tax=Nostoc sp. FACHB-110 TaxID=2692834 RepID=UPI00168349AA|nr:methyltransferase [Nostoc sp. FACHB-110]MBD2436643.1 ubiquinone/menaquinone biosynthesis protein [Nostoc sp. FACHB-110]
MSEQQTKKLSIPTCDDRLLWETWMSMFHFPTLTVADELGLFTLLEKSPATADEVAQSLDLGHRSTEALLGVMTSLGYLVQQNEKFAITEVSRNFLLPQSPFYWGGILHLMRSTPLSHASLLTALRNDKSTIYEDKDIWETHELEPEQAKAFTSHMHSQTVSPAVGAAIRGDFTSVKRLLDVGGGSGAFCFALAQHYPDLRCTILELPVVCKIADKYIAAAGLQARIDTKAGNFFTDPFPSGYDAILFGNIFHDWGREKCLHLARSSFAALPKGGKIYLHEILLSDTKDSPLVATAFSLCMVWVTEGKQFTAREIQQLLTECGFVDISITPTYGYYSLISATKP